MMEVSHVVFGDSKQICFVVVAVFRMSGRSKMKNKLPKKQASVVFCVARLSPFLFRLLSN